MCVSPSPASEALLRGANRLAAELHADWIAAYVETAEALRLDEAARVRLAEHLRLAQTLGAETVTLAGETGPEEVVTFARSRNVTRVIVGKPTHAAWRDRFRRSFLDRLVRASGDIDVHVLTGDVVEARPTPRPVAKAPAAVIGIASSAAAVGLATVISHAVFGPGQLPDVVMLYLLVVVLVALRWGLGPSLAASLFAIAAFDFFFIPPYHTFAVSDAGHTMTFAVMFLVGVVISGLTKRVRDQATAAHARELRTAALFSLSRSLADARSVREVLAVGTKRLHDVFQVQASALVEEEGALVPAAEGAWTFEVDDEARALAGAALRSGKPTGAGTEAPRSTGPTCFPLVVGDHGAGVLVLRGARRDELPHLEAFVALIASALERVLLAAEAERGKVRVEREVLKNSLLSSVSHDLRTPLAVITGAASAVLGSRIDEPTRRELLETVLSESERLNRLVRNVLDMTRLEAGALAVAKEWQPLEEAVGAALERAGAQLGERPVHVDVPADLLAPFDSVLLQQALVNLLENAAKYTPEDAAVSIAARRDGDAVEIVVADRGPGLPRGEEARIFDKFYRAEKGRGGGVGLGLTICKGIATAHGGRIWAENREVGGGAAFHLTLPLEGEPPALVPPESAKEGSTS